LTKLNINKTAITLSLKQKSRNSLKQTLNKHPQPLHNQAKAWTNHKNTNTKWNNKYEIGEGNGWTLNRIGKLASRSLQKMVRWVGAWGWTRPSRTDREEAWWPNVELDREDKEDW